MIERVLPDHVRRVQELRQNGDFVRDLYRIAEGRWNTPAEEDERRIGSGRRKEFYRVGTYEFSDGPIPLGISKGQISSGDMEFVEFYPYLTRLAMLVKLGAHLPVTNYRFIGYLPEEAGKRDFVMVLEDFGRVRDVEDIEIDGIGKMFQPWEGFFFKDKKGRLIAGDLSNANVNEEGEHREFEMQVWRALRKKKGLFEIPPIGQ